MKQNNFAINMCEKVIAKKFLLYLALLPSICFSQILNGSFEKDGKASFDNWVITCNDGQSFQDTPNNGGEWCLGFPTGNLQGCYPQTAEQVIKGLNNGDIVEVNVWARQDKQKLALTSIYLKIFQNDKEIILSKDTTTSEEWALLTVIDTLSLAEGDSVAIVLDSGITSGPDILGINSYFDLVDVKKNGQAVSINNDSDSPVKMFRLLPNYPNPFNPYTTIRYYLPKQVKIKLVIFNLLGEEVKTMVDDIQPAGENSVLWDGRNNSGKTVNSGIYIYRLQTENVMLSHKMILLK